MGPPKTMISQGDEVSNSCIGVWRDAAPSKAEPRFPPASGDAGAGSEVSNALFPPCAGCLTSRTSVQQAEPENVVPELTIILVSLCNAGELEEKQGSRDVPEPKLRRVMAPDLVVKMESEPAGNVMSQPGSRGGSFPRPEEGLSEPLGWLGNVLKWKRGVADWSWRGIPVRTVID